MSKGYNPMTANSIGIEKKCSICKKPFFVHDPKNHVYRMLNKKGIRVPVCSWKCMRIDEERRVGKLEEKRKKKIENELKGIKG